MNLDLPYDPNRQWQLRQCGAPSSGFIMIVQRSHTWVFKESQLDLVKEREAMNWAGDVVGQMYCLGVDPVDEWTRG